MAKTRNFLDILQKISLKYWSPGRDIGLDESQSRCVSSWERISHHGETKKPITDYIKIVSAHNSRSGYLLSFIVDTWDKRTTQLLMETVEKINLSEPYRISTDRYYKSISKN